MANDPRYRNSRPDRPSQDRQSGDPLSELARLIGQDDAVAGPARNGAPRRSSDRQEVASATPPRRPSPPMDELDDDSRSPPDRRGRYDDPDAREAAYLAEPPVAEESDAYDPRASNGGGYEAFEEEAGYHREGEPDDAGQYGNGDEPDAYGAPAYDDRYDEDPEAAGSEYENGPYYAQDGRMTPGGELYEEMPPARRRSRLFPLAVVLGVGVVGTAAAYAYRTWTNSGSDTPPVIRASTDPTKLMASGQSSDGQPGKQIYDRLDRGQGQNEQVVSREEEPVNPTRSLSGDALATPGAATGSLGGLPSGGPVASPPMLSGGTPTTEGEPRKVRTIPIRPDQSSGTPADASAANQSTSAPPDTTPAAPATTRTRAQTRMAKSAAPAAPVEPPPPAADTDSSAAPASGTHAPMALGAGAAPGQPRRLAAAANGADGTGHYVVQVSSQRTEADAQASYKALQQKYANLLGGHDPIIRRADLGDKGTFYRAQVGPFATMDEANQLCNSLKSAGGQCIIQRN